MPNLEPVILGNVSLICHNPRVNISEGTSGLVCRGKVRKFIHENQALMRRMYGNIRQVMVIRNELGGRRFEDGRKLMHHPGDEEGFFMMSQQPESPDKEPYGAGNDEDSGGSQDTSTEFSEPAIDGFDDEVQVTTEGPVEEEFDDEDTVTENVVAEDTEPTIPYDEASVTGDINFILCI